MEMASASEGGVWLCARPCLAALSARAWRSRCTRSSCSCANTWNSLDRLTCSTQPCLTGDMQHDTPSGPAHSGALCNCLSCHERPVMACGQKMQAEIALPVVTACFP